MIVESIESAETRTAWFARAGVVGPVLFTITWMTLGSMRSGYSFVTQPISGLGVGPNALLMNAAFVVTGLLMIVGAVGALRRIPETRRAHASLVLLSLPGAGTILCGLFTWESTAPHVLGFLLGAGGPIVAFLVVGARLRRSATWRRFGTALLLAGPLTLLLLVISGATFSIARVEANVGVAGLTERVAVIEIQVWYVVLAWLALRTNAIAKAYKGPAMEGFIATWYAKNTKGDARSYRECARAVAERVPRGGTVLEVAAGPGYLAIELAKLGTHQVCGLDISKSFVRIASENARAEGVSVEFREGNASKLPYPNSSFDFVVCRAAFKNFTDPAGALDEIHRVLKPGGKASIFDLRREATRDEVRTLVDGMNLSAFSSLWTKLTFRFFLLKNAYAADAIERLASRSRFGRCEVLTHGIEFDLRLAKP